MLFFQRTPRSFANQAINIEDQHIGRNYNPNIARLTPISIVIHIPLFIRRIASISRPKIVDYLGVA